MSKHSSSSNTIPSVLSIPEKLDAFRDRLFKLRMPLDRRFSGRDILLAAGAALLLILSSAIRALSGLRAFFCIAALLIAAVPVCLQGWRLILKKRIPLEEGALLLAAVVAALIREYAAAPLILIFATVICQTEAYCLLHREAAPDYLSEADLRFRNAVENADEEKSPERRMLASCALAFFALFVLIAFVFAVCTLFHLKDYAVWLHRTVIFLALAGPSAFLFSSLLSHFAAIYSAAKANILFENDAIPEGFARCRLFAFSKTGTITDGKYIISEISPVGLKEEDLLKIAAIGESQSQHPIALALKAAAGLQDGAVPEDRIETKEIPGRGVSTFFSGHHIHVGNAGLLEENGIWYQIPKKSGSAIHVAVDGTYRGYIMISDAIRDNAFEALEEMRALGASTLVMLTGDVRSTARTLASSMNFDMVKPELTAEEKGSAIRFLRSSHGERAKIAVIGDGFHDAGMFDAADVSVCLEPQNEDFRSDVSIYSDDITRIPLSFRICRSTERVLFINTAALLLVKLLLAVLGAAAVLQTGLVVGLDCLVGAAACIYALTCFTLEKRGR
ncbi:MAG: HAD-IC family P-type ATPase [Oscillospiraceae bacterium]|nr:HAD-IC family P-type ATPase [Oscillospiraceae bacterium]